MGEKDITEKTLEDYADVFADIVNVLLFDGERRVLPEDLVDTTARSQFKSDDGVLHEQERDVVKRWKHGKIVIALLGLENQTKPDENMPLRVFSYEGASYKSQLLDEVENFFPVITLVLYFGKQRWEKARSLYEKLEVPEELRPYVNDFSINVFEISYLSEEQLAMFRSDFGVVAEYFVRSRTDPGYKPKKKVIKHVDAFLKMMKAVTGDHRYEEVRKSVRKGERITMCEVLDYRERRGEERGEKRGEKRGEQRGMQRGIQRGIERDRRVLNRLNDLLLEDGRIEDLKRSTKDSDFQQKLLDEYGLKV